MSLLPLRAWYGGCEPPTETLLTDLEAGESAPSTLCVLGGGEIAGEFTDIVLKLLSKMQALGDDRDTLESFTPERSRHIFVSALSDCAAEAPKRLALLKELGVLRFPANMDVFGRREQLRRLFAAPENATAREAHLVQSDSLAEIWRPEADSLLDFVLNRPTHIGRLVAARLNPDEAPPLAILAHPCDRLDEPTFLPVRRHTWRPCQRMSPPPRSSAASETQCWRLPWKPSTWTGPPGRKKSYMFEADEGRPPAG